MPDIQFRPCRPEDVDSAVPLIYSSGPASFDYVFCSQHAAQAQEFLRHAYLRGRSEFGFQQHVAAVLEGAVVGVGALRDGSQNRSLALAALRDIASFYPPASAARTLVRGLRIERVIRPPKTGVGILYHLGVAEAYRSRGIGRRLVQELLRGVVDRRLPVAALDVAQGNPRARQLYENLGFVARRLRPSTLQSRFGRVVAHCYMELPLPA
jgi:ribosomal protein S18 acetylase RimI-like enzyme